MPRRTTACKQKNICIHLRQNKALLMERYATVVWNGSGKDGRGVISTQSAAVNEVPFSFNSRFISADGTNPEELLAAALASCFIMKLNFVLEAAEFKTNAIETTAFINFERGLITGVRLAVKVQAPGIKFKQLNTSVQEAKNNCPISQVLNIDVTADISLKE